MATPTRMRPIVTIADPAANRFVPAYCAHFCPTKKSMTRRRKLETRRAKRGCETATKDAPWYVVPADNKWFTRVVVATAVIEALADLDLAYPEVGEDKLKELAAARKKLLSK